MTSHTLHYTYSGAEFGGPRLLKDVEVEVAGRSEAAAAVSVTVTLAVPVPVTRLVRVAAVRMVVVLLVVRTRRGGGCVGVCVVRRMFDCGEFVLR
jgi:hypothetical protein